MRSLEGIRKMNAQRALELYGQALTSNPVLAKKIARAIEEHRANVKQTKRSRKS